MNDKQFTDVSNPEHVLFEGLITRDPSRAIENQEARGQAALVAAQHMPKEIQGRGVTWEQLREFWGLEIVHEVDDLFVAVKLPEGWRIERTDHSMWTKLLDATGAERAGIFYKAAFYDRRAFFHLKNRYTYSSYRDVVDGVCFTRVYDDAAGVVLFEAGSWKRDDPDFKKSERIQKAAEDWLNEHFPAHRDPFAYWPGKNSTPAVPQQ